jgi:hypothetical protein
VSSFVGALGWWLEAAFRVVAVEQRVRRVGGLARFVVGEPRLQVEKPHVLSNHRANLWSCRQSRQRPAVERRPQQRHRAVVHANDRQPDQQQPPEGGGVPRRGCLHDDQRDAQGAITFKWQFTCMYTSDTDSACQGPWHITGGTGAYEGAQGGGTALDLCVDEYNGTQYTGTSCSDTLNSMIQVP